MVVEITCEEPEAGLDLERLERLAESICRRFGTNDAAVEIAIVGDETISKVNVEFLNESYETDVISFDLSDGPDGQTSFELVVNLDEAKRQARQRGHCVEAEVGLYITHGLLHNLGFDDCDEAGSREMHLTEDDILTDAGYGTVYGARPKQD